MTPASGEVDASLCRAGDSVYAVRQSQTMAVRGRRMNTLIVVLVISVTCLSIASIYALSGPNGALVHE